MRQTINFVGRGKGDKKNEMQQVRGRASGRRPLLP